MHIKHLTFVVFLGFYTTVAAQNPDAAPLLSVEEAVKIALENNYAIKIAAGNTEIARLNNTRGNAGQLPTVNLTANETFTLSAFQQKLASGNEFNAFGAPFNNVNAAVVLNWTLWDGRRMYIAKNRLDAEVVLSELGLRTQSQQTVAAVLLAYCDIARVQAQTRALRELIALNEERLRIAEARLAAGFAAQTDALAAKIELQQRQSDLLTLQNAAAAAKNSLNLLLVRDAGTDFRVDEAAISTTLPSRADLESTLKTQNPDLLALQKAREIAAMQVDETRTLNKPRIVGIGQFNATRADNGAGFLLNSTQAGLAAGASLNVPLYTGGNYRRQVETAQVAAQQSNLRSEQQLQALLSELDNLLAFAQTQNNILRIESDNIELARQNLQISTERFRLGQTNNIEPQTAQNALEQALLRRTLANFNLQTTAVRLRLIGGIL